MNLVDINDCHSQKSIVPRRFASRVGGCVGNGLGVSCGIFCWLRCRCFSRTIGHFRFCHCLSSSVSNIHYSLLSPLVQTAVQTSDEDRRMGFRTRYCTVIMGDWRRATINVCNSTGTWYCTRHTDGDFSHRVKFTMFVNGLMRVLAV